MSEQQENEALPGVVPPRKAAFKRPGFKPPTFVQPAAKKPIPAALPALPLAAVAKVADAPPSAAAAAGDAPHYYFSVLYCKYQPTKKLRKNKQFNDGILEIKPGNKAVLYDSEGKVTSQSQLRGYDAVTLGNGSQVLMGNWEIEIEQTLPPDKFSSGEAFLKPTATATLASATVTSTTPLRPNTVVPLPLGFKAPGVSSGFKPPLGRKSSTAAATATLPAASKPAPPLHDPLAPGAVVLNADQWNNGEGRDAQGRPITAVVLDPLLARQMRPHQLEGVKFLYECCAGLRNPGQLGCILADAMGLGKTLQTIGALWALLKQGPHGGRPLVNKALIVTPSSLCRNWAQEVKKWLGDTRLRTLVVSPGAEGAAQVLELKHGAARVGIISYETLRQHASALAGCIGLLIADEGHRLKSAAGNKTIAALTALHCPRRILLTGTPVQNQLQEFYAMATFCNPDALGTLSVFNRVFGHPIARSHDRDATEEERTLGQARSEELARRVESFVLRRGAEVNSAYLPPLSLYVVFTPPTPVQLRLLTSELGSGSVRRLLTASGSDFGDQVLTVLTNIRKICGHPVLYDGVGKGEHAAGEGVGASAPASEIAINAIDAKQSGKMAALEVLLCHIIGGHGDRSSNESSLATSDPRRRCVVVSQSTAMLDVIARVCAQHGWSTVRLDGSTEVSRRQDLVNSFNSFGVGQIFLLSTTAGGAGLNLTGACRLILCDLHWNPAMDAQAMARVWREGQSHPCHVYRLITTGCMEEKVYQRQRAKGDVAAATVGVDAGNNKASTSKVRAGQQGRGQFSRDELRQLFTVRTDTRCDTADMLAAAGETFEDCSDAQDLDPPLVAAVAAGHISFVHVERRKGQRAAQPVDHLHEEAVAAKEMPMTAATQHKGEDVMMVGCGDASELDVEDSMA